MHFDFRDSHRQIAGLTAADLEILSSVTEITSYLIVQANHSDITSLSFLRNLRYIRGRELDQSVFVSITPFTKTYVFNAMIRRDLNASSIIISDFNVKVCII